MPFRRFDLKLESSATRVAMPPARRYRYPTSKSLWRKCAQTEILVTLALIVASLSVSCRRSDPQFVYDRAWSAFQKGDLRLAEQEAKKGYDDFHGSSHEWAWKFTILRARILYERGGYDEVLKLLASERSVLPPGELAVQKVRFEGLAHLSARHFPDADEKFTEAERICASSYSPACTDVVTARGKLEMERGRYAAAQAYFEHVLNAARASGDQLWVADALLDLSWSANEQAHFDEVLDWSDEARRISVKQGVPDITQAAIGNMGWAYYKLGELEKAEGTFADAERQAEKVGDQPDQVKWLTNAGYADMDAGKVSVAKQAFRQSLDLAQKIKNREDIVNSLIALAFVSEQTNELDDAKHYADEALKMARADGNKRDETYPQLVQGRIAAKQHDAATAEAAFHEVAESSDSPVFLKWEAERSLAHLYEDENQVEAARREYQTALSTFETARSELQHENSRLPFLNNATRIYDDYVRFLVKQGKTDEALQVAEYDRARTLNEGLGILKKATSFHPDPLNAPQIARRAGGSILFYWLGERQSYLWLITTQKTSFFSLPASSEIDAAVQRYRKALIGPQDPLDSSNDDGFGLYRTLVAPAAALLPKNAKVIIIPDGSLNTLNFETLLVPESKPHYWIEDVTVADASSLRLLVAPGAARMQAKRLLLLGSSVTTDPDYPELRKAPAEIDSIEKHFSSTQQEVFTREQATPAAYLNGKPEQFSYIHFVAHGTASRLSPLESAIVLSPSTARSDSFKLYAREIVQHPLRADLVTISTCYGAGTRAYSGEGLVGLSWAFIRAGAHNVVGALWEVSDVSTPQLMDELYAELMKGQSPDSALRGAKLAMLHSKTAFRKPFYWAPFQLYSRS